MTRKSFSLPARRSVAEGGYVAQIAYENETYPRHILQKSPEATRSSAADVASVMIRFLLYWYVVESTNHRIR